MPPAQRPAPDAWSDLVDRIGDGDDRHRRRRLHRHAGPAAGQAAARPLLRRPRRRPRHRGLQLPAGRRRRHEHRRRLRHLLVGARATATWSSSSTSGPSGCSPTCRRPRWSSATWSGPTTPPSSSRRGRSCSASWTGSPSAAGRRWPAPSWSSSRSTRRTSRPHSTRYRDLTPVNQYNVDYSILGTTRVEPLLRAIRNHMYDAGLDVEGAKGECNFGQHEIGFLYADALDHRRQPRGLQDRRQGDRRPAGQVDHVHGEVQRARGQLLPHPPVAARRGRRAGVLGRGAGRADAALRPLRRRRARHDRRLHAALRAEHQLLQAVRRRLVRADHDRLGPRQPHLRGPPRRPRRRRPDGEPGARRRRQPLPRAGRDARRRAARHRERAARSRTSWSATPTRPAGPRCPATMAGGPGGVRHLRDRPGGPG